MPGGDGTGPMSLGAGFGWGRGPCGAGPRLRRHFGWRNQEPINLSEEEQKKILEAEKKEIEKRLSELNA